MSNNLLLKTLETSVASQKILMTNFEDSLIHFSVFFSRQLYVWGKIHRSKVSGKKITEKCIEKLQITNSNGQIVVQITPSNCVRGILWLVLKLKFNFSTLRVLEIH